MPRGDGTGPTGMGPLTGRGLGTCAGNTVPGSANPVRRQVPALGTLGRWMAGVFPRLGLGLRRGQHLGRGMGRGRNRR